MDNDVPEWIKARAPAIDKAMELIGPSRDEMYRALELYHTHVKHVMTIMFTLLTALIAVIGLSGKIGGQELPTEAIRLLVGTFLIIVAPLGVCAVFILLRYYQVYVSALLFAVRVHWAAGLGSSHPWFVRTIIQTNKWSKVKCDVQFLRRRAISPSDTFFLYAMMILLLSLLSVFSGIIIL